MCGQAWQSNRRKDESRPAQDLIVQLWSENIRLPSKVSSSDKLISGVTEKHSAPAVLRRCSTSAGISPVIAAAC